MTEELYINGELADMSSSGITLNYRSGIFSDVSKIYSNYTNTIKLPRTARNHRILKTVNVSTKTTTMRVYHKCDIIIDGVVIVKNGKLVILNVDSDKIEVSVIWGINLALAKLAEMESVRDLKKDLLTWTVDSINYGAHNCIPVSTTQLPYINAIDLLNHVLAEYDMQAVIDDNNTQKALTEWKIPLVDRRQVTEDAEEKYNSMNGINGRYNIANTWGDSDDTWKEVQFIDFENDWESKSPYLSWVNTTYTTIGGQTYYYNRLSVKSSARNVRLRIDGSMEAMFYTTSGISISDGYEAISKVSLDFVVIKGETQKVITSIEATMEFDRISGGSRYYIATFRPVEVEGLFGSGDILMAIHTPANVFFDYIHRCEFTFHAEIYPVMPDGDFYYGMQVIPNLPKLKPIDYIKGICAMAGMFVYVDGEEIHFKSYKSLIEGRDSARNWSDLLLDDNPKVEYTLDGVGQTNLCLFQESDIASISHDAAYTVDSEILPLEATYAELPFTNTNFLSSDGRAYVPIYEFQKEDDVWGNFRIAETDEAYILSVAYEPLSWEYLLRDFHSERIQVLRDIKIITTKVRLSLAELSGLKFSTPVYFRKFGAYFAILEVKTKKNNICEVKLIKI